MAGRKPNPWDRRGEGSPSAVARLGAARAQKAGATWEAQLDQFCEHYRVHGTAHIRQVGAPFRTIGPQKGRFMTGEYTGPGGCDFIGHINGVPFEADAKHCSQPRWSYQLLEEHQARSLNAVAKHGGHAGLLLRLDDRGWWLPWADLGPLWWAWSKAKVRGECAKRGTASLNLKRCMAIGRSFRGGDFLPAVLGGPRG